MKHGFIVMCLLFSFPGLAQHNWDDKHWDKKSLGFGCGFAATSTKPVQKALKLFYKKDYEKIKMMLDSESTAEQFLAAFLFEKLAEKGILSMSEANLEKIEQIKQSEELVPVCSGCTFWLELPLAYLFTNRTIIYFSAENWFRHHYKLFLKK